MPMSLLKSVCSCFAEHLRKSLEELLEEFEVDMVISGHVHAYARTCNLYKEECISDDDGGTTYITMGGIVTRSVFSAFIGATYRANLACLFPASLLVMQWLFRSLEDTNMRFLPWKPCDYSYP